MNIETERTVFREFHLEDVDDLQEILGDEQVMEYLEPPYESPGGVGRSVFVWVVEGRV